MKPGIISKLLSAALTTFGGNLGGDVIAPVVNNAVPITLGISSSRALNVATEGAAYATALVGEYVGDMKGRAERYGAKYAEDLLDGIAGGMAGAADPITMKTGRGSRMPSWDSSGQGVGL
jgi:hypothetical protein